MRPARILEAFGTANAMTRQEHNSNPFARRPRRITNSSKSPVERTLEFTHYASGDCVCHSCRMNVFPATFEHSEKPMFRTSRRINKQQTDGRRHRSGRSRIFRKCKRQLARKIKITCNTSERRTTRESDRRPIAFKAEVKMKAIPSHANVG